MNDTGIKQYAEAVAKKLIGESPLGGELSDKQCTTLAGIMKVSELKEGEMLLKEGHVDDSLHVVVNGKLEVFKGDQGGEEVLLTMLHTGDMAGEMGFIDGAPHTASLRAVGKCEVITFRRNDFEDLIRKDPELVYKVMRAVMRTVHRILRRMNFQYTQLTDYIMHQHGRY
ncbi:MAG: cyclic nucleotide-binding domain-containing protein [Gammaproteobacteria bacterium]|nr:cyclic nucleotide-binding domain-containing protein [Gammaproteobacteria bacterium]